MRRYDLDWLRVLVFGLLIFYHVGMFFVPWGFHIKNNVIYSWLVYPMLFLNQWRLPILFVISGMGTYYALSKRSELQFIWERIKRLFIPLVFGMLVIVPPQVYIERIAKCQFVGSYFDYWPDQAFIGTYPVGNLSWHHLWFLPYLLLFSILLVPVFLYLRKNPQNHLLKWVNKLVSNPIGIYTFIVPLYILEAFVEPFFPVTHGLVHDWFNGTNCATFFLYGFILISVRDSFWPTLEKYRKHFLITALLAFSIWLSLIISFEDSYLRHFTEAILKVFNLWSWILAIFGYAAFYLNKPGKYLSYANQAVYPFYILHQSIMIVIAYYLMDLDWVFFPKATIMIVGTFAGSWIIYEFLIRRVKILWPFFGLKSRQFGK